MSYIANSGAGIAGFQDSPLVPTLQRGNKGGGYQIFKTEKEQLGDLLLVAIILQQYYKID